MDRPDREMERQLREHQRTTAKAEQRAMAAEVLADRLANRLQGFMAEHDACPGDLPCSCELCAAARAVLQEVER